MRRALLCLLRDLEGVGILRNFFLHYRRGPCHGARMAARSAASVGSASTQAAAHTRSRVRVARDKRAAGFGLLFMAIERTLRMVAERSWG